MSRLLESSSIAQVLIKGVTALLFLLQLFSQPGSYWFIIQLQTRIGQHQRSCKCQQRIWPGLQNCSAGVIAYPRNVEIHQHIMRHVKRIRYIPEELTDFLFALITNDTTGADIYYQWENDNNAKSFIQAIYPKMIRTAQSWHKQNSGNQQAAPGEGIFDMDWPSNPRQ